MSIKNKSFIEDCKHIPIFFACDDHYVKYMLVTMQSVIDNCSSDRRYMFHVLHTDITPEKQAIVMRLECDNVKIAFFDVSEDLARIEKQLTLRDYYSNTTYYRIFISDMFPQYDKILYIDSDIILNDDIGKLYSYNLRDNYIGAIRDYLIESTETFGNYAEKVLGLSRTAYFNAGVVLINCDQFRKQKIKKQFIEFLDMYSFVVAQDQDYLNVLCSNRVQWLDSRWNVQMSEKTIRPDEKISLIHYNLSEKPWHYENGRYSDYYWKYAEKTFFYNELRRELKNFSETDREKDKLTGEKLNDLAIEEINNEDNYLNKFGELVSNNILSRQEVVARIEQLEKEGRFDEDVEADPPSRELMPNEVDYLKKKYSSRIRSRYAFKVARWFMNSMIRKKKLIIKEVTGIENYQNLESGAIITCNHFNAFDSFAMHIAYDMSKQKHRKLFRIIKEGNYTSFPGFYGYLMRNCNTLPLSSNRETMKKMMKATDTILQRGHFVLIYPEQSMWWNYRKPKPLKKGAYTFAAKNNVPVLPCFITMQDTDIPDQEDYMVQEYTIHIGSPIYPDKSKKAAQNAQEMMEKNYQVWKDVYEKTYGIPLKYTCDED